MDDKITDIFKKFDPNVLKALEGLNISKVIKQLEQLKISGLLEKLEDLNRLSKLLSQMDDIKISEIVKKVEDIKLSNILKQIEDNKLPEILNNIPNPLKQLKYDYDTQGSIRIENRIDSIPDQIKKLYDLKNMSIITEDEFQQKKKQLLDRI